MGKISPLAIFSFVVAGIIACACLLWLIFAVVSVSVAQTCEETHQDCDSVEFAFDFDDCDGNVNAVACPGVNASDFNKYCLCSRNGNQNCQRRLKVCKDSYLYAYATFGALGGIICICAFLAWGVAAVTLTGFGVTKQIQAVRGVDDF